MRKRTKVIIGITTAVVILATAVLGYVGNYFYNIALNPNTEREFMDNNPDLESSAQAAAMNINWDEEMRESQEWLNSTPHEEVTLQSSDGLALRGYEYTHEDTNQWVVVVHGYTAEAKKMGASTKAFYEKGFNVLLVDLRGHGESEGDYIGMGWDDRKDIVGWIESIVAKDSDSEIILYGVSMGGATVMMTSGEELPANVKAIIEDCGYTSAWNEFSYQLNRIFELPEFPILNVANIVANIRAGYDLKEASALDQVAKSKTPILFIHGTADTFVPYEMVYELYNAAGSDKDLLIIEGAGHGEAARIGGETYWNKVWEFTDKYIVPNELM